MKKTETKEPFKLNVLGLFTLETTVEKMCFKKILLLTAVILIFILAVIIVLRWYAIPSLGLPAIVAKISRSGIGKIMKSRAP